MLGANEVMHVFPKGDVSRSAIKDYVLFGKPLVARDGVLTGAGPRQRRRLSHRKFSMAYAAFTHASLRSFCAPNRAKAARAVMALVPLIIAIPSLKPRISGRRPVF